MALLKRELHRQVKGPEITHADRCTLVFDTDTKRLYVESEVAHLIPVEYSTGKQPHWRSGPLEARRATARPFEPGKAWLQGAISGA